MPIACQYCYYEVPMNLGYRHLSLCGAFQQSGRSLPVHARYWPPHEFVKQKYMMAGGGMPDPNRKKRDVIWEALWEPWIRASVESELNSILKSTNKLQLFDATAFAARIKVSKDPYFASLYYRKMSTGEYQAVHNKTNPFQGTFDYINTKNYRYWMSSSLKKVQAFGNENSSDNGGVVVKIKFSKDPITVFGKELAAHQQQGVQSDASKVAVHREGFAEVGNMSCQKHLQEVLGPPRLHHNLGFTASQSAELKKILESFTKL